MRRALAMTAELIEDFLRGPAGWAAVTTGHNAACTIATLRVGEDAAAQVVWRLAGVEVRIGTLGTGMPNVNRGTGNRRALRIDDTPVKKHHRTRIGAVVHPRFAFGQRRAGLSIFGVLQQIQKMLDTQACHQQTGFLVGAHAIEVVHGFPEFVVTDFKVLNQPRGVLDNAQDDLLETTVALVIIDPGHFIEKILDVSSVGDFHGHGCYPILLLLNGSTIVGMNRRRVTTQPVYLDIHVGKQRQLHQRVMQCFNTGHIEHAVVGIVASNAP
ncbi:hypothetical protein D3C75_850320 [compost metagenome]